MTPTYQMENDPAAGVALRDIQIKDIIKAHPNGGFCIITDVYKNIQQAEKIFDGWHNAFVKLFGKELRFKQTKDTVIENQVDEQKTGDVLVRDYESIE